jgi:C-1 hydroxylase
MSVEENKAAVRRLHEAVNKRDWTTAMALFAPDFVFHSTPEAKGPEGFRQTMTTMVTAFPDYSEKIENIIAEGDMVVVSYTLQGTFTGEMPGYKPTGKKFSLPAVIICRFKDGKQVDARPHYDTMAWNQQLGVSPPGQ